MAYQPARLLYNTRSSIFLFEAYETLAENALTVQKHVLFLVERDNSLTCGRSRVWKPALQNQQL